MNRFWDKVDKSGECWVWTGAKTSAGYGALGFGHAHVKLAHRVSLELAGVTVPPHMTVHHECHTKTCVRPEHLKVISRSEHGLLDSPKNEHCPCGRDYDIFTTNGGGKPSRKCSVCTNEKRRERYARGKNG